MSRDIIDSTPREIMVDRLTVFYHDKLDRMFEDEGLKEDLLNYYVARITIMDFDVLEMEFLLHE